LRNRLGTNDEKRCEKRHRNDIGLQLGETHNGADDITAKGLGKRRIKKCNNEKKMDTILSTKKQKGGQLGDGFS